MSAEPENAGGKDAGQAQACAFHLMFGVTIHLDAHGQCPVCATAPTDADNEPDDRYREIGYD